MKRISKIIKFLRAFEPKDGYFVAFSGGKDSIVVLDLVRRAGVKHTAHFNRTSVDPPEVIGFVRKYYSDVTFLRPEMSMYQLIVKKGMLPLRNNRFCCKYLKEYSGVWRYVVTGIRRQESVARKNREFVSYDPVTNKIMIHPILFWSDSDVWGYIRRRGLPYPSLYDSGYSRLGCIGCPMQPKRDRLRDFRRYPTHKKAYLWAIEKVIEAGGFTSFESAESVFSWWLSGESQKNYIFSSQYNQLVF